MLDGRRSQSSLERTRWVVFSASRSHGVTEHLAYRTTHLAHRLMAASRFHDAKSGENLLRGYLGDGSRADRGASKAQQPRPMIERPRRSALSLLFGQQLSSDGVEGVL